MDWARMYANGTLSDADSRGWLAKFIASDGTLTDDGAHDFCRRHRIPKAWNALLGGLDKVPDPVDTSTRQWLLRTKLITHDNQVTEVGRIKLIESLKLAEQCATLQVPMEIVQLQRLEGLSTEAHAIAHLQQAYPEHLIVHDEHLSLGTIFYSCLLAHYDKLAPQLSKEDQAVFEDRRYLIGFDLWNFDAASIECACSQIIATTRADFDRGFALAVDLHKSVQQSLENRGLFRGSEFYWRLFEGYGNELLSDLARFRVTQPYLSFPDLCIVGSEGVSLIEVKAKDKLSFGQIYTFELLKQLKQRHRRIRDLGVLRLDFPKEPAAAAGDSPAS